MLGVVACVGVFALALLSLQRVGRSPLALPLALLCFDLLVWNAASLAYDATGDLRLRWLDVSTSPLTAPLAVELVLAFVGERRRWRPVRIVYWAWFGALALLSAVIRDGFAGSRLWAALHLAGLLPAMGFAVLLLARHRSDGLERARARLLLAAMAVGALGGASEVLDNLYPWVPELGSVSVLVAVGLVSLVALRLRLFDDAVSLDAAALAVLLACAAAAAQLFVLRALGGNAAALTLATAAGALALAAVVRRASLRSAEEKARVGQLATLGRFSAQMAHDLRNPLAALRGAAQVIERDVPPAQREFVKLMIDQIDRLDGTVERYRRLSQVQPLRARISLNDVVRQVLALQAFASGGVAVRAELAEPLPECDGDRELLATALENLLRNAFESGAGAVTVRTSLDGGALLLSAEDDGPGMDARTRERAFDDFFTTKASGSGLGLAFVRRVAEAHGGEALLSARAGRGTVVSLRLPPASDEWPKSAQPS